MCVAFASPAVEDNLVLAKKVIDFYGSLAFCEALLEAVERHCSDTVSTSFLDWRTT